MKPNECAVGQEVTWEDSGNTYEGMIVSMLDGVKVLALTENGKEIEPENPDDREEEWQKIAPGKLTLKGEEEEE